MTEELAGMSRVTEPMHKPIEDYTHLLMQLAGSTAKALTLFGAIAAGSFDVDRHTARNVLVVGQVDLQMLRQLATHGAKLGKVNIAAPLIMTPEYIKASLDTFPLELLEIQQNHITVFGEAYFEELTFKVGDVRLECERELKTMLIGMRQGLLAAAGREKLVGALGMDVGEGMMRTLRGLLWLKGQKDAGPAAQVLSEVERITKRGLSGVRTALDPLASHGWEEFTTLYHDVEALVEVADEW